jgi:hypothetical protein
MKSFKGEHEAPLLPLSPPPVYIYELNFLRIFNAKPFRFNAFVGYRRNSCILLY